MPCHILFMAWLHVFDGIVAIIEMFPGCEQSLEEKYGKILQKNIRSYDYGQFTIEYETDKQFAFHFKYSVKDVTFDFNSQTMGYRQLINREGDVYRSKMEYDTGFGL